MSKAYLALKAVSQDGGQFGSIYAKNQKFYTTYEIGKRVTCLHPKFPFWLPSAYCFMGGYLSVGAPYTHILLMRVLAKDVSVEHAETYRATDKVDEPEMIEIEYRNIVNSAYPTTSTKYLFAKSLLPLEFVPASVTNFNDYLKEKAKQYHLPVLK